MTMFKLKPDPTFWVKVGIPIPGGDPVEIGIEFKALARSAFQQLTIDTNGKNIHEIMPDLIVGWRNVDQAFSREALALLMENFPASGRVMWQAFLDELTAVRLGK